MGSIRRAVVPDGITVLAFFSVLVAPLLAKDKPPKKSTAVPATVIAHLLLPQATGNQKLLQKESGRIYLYVQQASKQGFMLVDVTKPDKAKLAEAKSRIELSCRSGTYK